MNIYGKNRTIRHCHANRLVSVSETGFLVGAVSYLAGSLALILAGVAGKAIRPYDSKAHEDRIKDC